MLLLLFFSPSLLICLFVKAHLQVYVLGLRLFRAVPMYNSPSPSTCLVSFMTAVNCARDWIAREKSREGRAGQEQRQRLDWTQWTLGARVSLTLRLCSGSYCCCFMASACSIKLTFKKRQRERESESEWNNVNWKFKCHWRQLPPAVQEGVGMPERVLREGRLHHRVLLHSIKGYKVMKFHSNSTEAETETERYTQCATNVDSPPRREG